MATINREEIAWAAGFFDGEGCFTSGSAGKYPVTRITQADAHVLERFRAAVGVGRVIGPFAPSSGIKPIYHYVANGAEKTQAIGAMLWVFLSPIKRNQFRERMSKADWAGLRRTPEHRSKIAAGRRAFFAKRRLTDAPE